jgi:hypothetical protein
MSRTLLRSKQGPAAVELPAPRPRNPLLKRPEAKLEAPPAAIVAAPPAVAPATRALTQRLTEYAALLTALVAVVVGYVIRQSDAFVPYEGTGYYLGIAGGVGMLLQLIYPYVKKLRAFHTVIASRALFHLHMILGLGAPILILYHCKFSWGARNSNVALIAMFLVVASGLAGRMVHRKIQAGLRNRDISKDLMQARAEYLRDILEAHAGGTGWLVAERLSALTALAVAADTTMAQQLWIAFGAPFRIGMARIQFARLIRGAVTQNATLHGWSTDEQTRFRTLASQQVTEFLSDHAAASQFKVWERLLSSWHLLHVPLFYFLVAAGIAHVVAVHWY